MNSKLTSRPNIPSIDRERLCFLSEFGQPLANWLASLPGRCAVAVLFCALGLLSAWAAYRAGMAAAVLEYKATWHANSIDPNILRGLSVTYTQVFGYFAEGSLGLFSVVGVPLLIFFALSFAATAGKAISSLSLRRRLIVSSYNPDAIPATTWVANHNAKVRLWVWISIWAALTLIGVLVQRNEIHLAQLRVQAHEAKAALEYDPRRVVFETNDPSTPGAKRKYEVDLGWDFGTYQAPWTKVCAEIFNDWKTLTHAGESEQLILLKRRQYDAQLEKRLLREINNRHTHASYFSVDPKNPNDQTDPNGPEELQKWETFRREFGKSELTFDPLEKLHIDKAIQTGKLELSCESRRQISTPDEVPPLAKWMFIIISQMLLFGLGYTIALFCLWKIALFVWVLRNAVRPSKTRYWKLVPVLPRLPRPNQPEEVLEKFFGLEQWWKPWDSLLGMLAVLGLYLCLQQAVPLTTAREIAGPSGGTRETIIINFALAGLFLGVTCWFYCLLRRATEARRQRRLKALHRLMMQPRWQGEKYETLEKVEASLLAQTVRPPFSTKNLVYIGSLTFLWLAAFPTTAAWMETLLKPIKLDSVARFPVVLHDYLAQRVTDIAGKT